MASRAEARVVEELRQIFAQGEPRVEMVTLILGDGQGNVETSNPVVHYARLLRGDTPEKPVRCLNYATAAQNDLYVEAVKLPYPTFEAAYYVVRLGARISQNATEPFLPLHAPTHRRMSGGVRGRDPLDVHNRMIVQGRVDPTNPPSMAVHINYIRYRWAGQLREFPNTTTSLLSAAPSMQQVALVYFVPAQNNYGIRYGPPGYPPDEPGVGEGEYPLASILLTPSTTAISDDVIVDRRDILSLSALEQEGGGDVITITINNIERTVIINASDADVVHNITTMSLPVTLI